MSCVVNPVVPHQPVRDYAYYRAALAGQTLPAAFVDLDSFSANLEALKIRAAGLPVRLVTKSVRSMSMIRSIFTAAPFMQGLLCYSPAEAAWLASEGFDDIVVAYPSVEPAHLHAVAAQLREGRSITLMVDCIEQVSIIDTLAKAEGVVFPLSIDLDMSSSFPGIYFGVHRSPVRNVTTALALANEISCRSGVRLDGLMGYEGQIAGLMDAVPGEAVRSAIIRYLKRRSIREVTARRENVVKALTGAGHCLRFVNGGGTGSFESTRIDTSVTELAAGSGLYVPTLFDHYAAFKAAPAAGFALPVTRTPKRNVITCAGGGYIASGPAGKSRLPQPWLPAGCTLIDEEAAGEVQTPVCHPDSVAFGIGDPMLFRHAKAGELCERFNELLLIKDGHIVDRVTTYRGDGKSFL
ncbi:D-serine deaminase, pyridoxal phosphate-dependent [Paraburkholderia steynii]|uniref:D-serine deaminase, pyridoxal phosphate-dependent n=1 Tax=Paraburkholderia steynii TaxID=1245441 RepID=A0A7Z7BM48_9BURK|nr:amino acid deaminase/aldolase [Paraburkholderia steynii]SDJ56658.1 D-serine deaminase, pyridoxal phosphate-dependent [Paraburkholderia steynii]